MTPLAVPLQPVLRTTTITKVFQRFGGPFVALHKVSLALNAGETLGIIGESGAGKTTFGRIAVGLENPTSGAIYIGGERMDALRAGERRRRFLQCQMIFQDPFSSLNPRLKIGRQIGEAIFVRGVTDWQEIGHEVGNLLERVGLRREHADRYPNEFSGGQRQRIAIARALAPSPMLLVADEPVSALDVRIQGQILELIEDIRKALSLSCILISHDLSVVARLCDRVAVIHKGRIVELGPTSSLIERPQHPQTKNIIDAVPRLGRRRLGSRRTLEIVPECDIEDDLVEAFNGHFVLESVAKSPMK
ncbi:ABC transporter ATP-binding protein [Rhizobium cauense]|uniref:ABC transporter ATP-binding protein n=1 Tax=Rhizobium cauense TaxID=1166683 RepID=UPI001C6EE7F1|nr:ATP-binding cassette domain-containing protein [Rhizobium cauense]MBW9116827.1 ABC transporter ATP-binding protein [Rhizobium cauense]